MDTRKHLARLCTAGLMALLMVAAPLNAWAEDSVAANGETATVASASVDVLASAGESALEAADELAVQNDDNGIASQEGEGAANADSSEVADVSDGAAGMGSAAGSASANDAASANYASASSAADASSAAATSSSVGREEGISLAANRVTIPLSECTISTTDFDRNYTGNALEGDTPVVCVKGSVLKKYGVAVSGYKGSDFDSTRFRFANTQYKVTFSNNVNAGTATTTVTATGAYASMLGNYDEGGLVYTSPIALSGTWSGNYEICAANISNAVVAGLKSTVKKGELQNPTLTFKNKTLVEGKDYKLVYHCEATAGSAYLDIQGIGNFTGHSWYSYTVENSSLATESIAGAERFETAQKINAAEAAYGNYKGVIVASGEQGRFADALCASGLSGLLSYPIVLVNGSGSPLNASSAAALSQFRNNAGASLDIIVVGGTSAVNNSIEAALKAYGNITRLGGATRYETAKLVYAHGEKSGGWNTECAIIARGDNFADSLSIASYASTKKAPIMLVASTASSLDSYFAGKLSSYKSSVILGKTAAVRSSVESQVKRSISNTTRLGGDTRYETSVKIAEWSLQHGLSATNIGFARGDNFPDSLAAGFLLAKRSAPLVLVNGQSGAASSEVKNLIASYGVATTKVTFFGGTASISSATRSALTSQFKTTSRQDYWTDANSGDTSSSASLCGICGYERNYEVSHSSHRLQRCPTCGYVGSYDELGRHLHENCFFSDDTGCEGGNFNNGGTESINKGHRNW